MCSLRRRRMCKRPTLDLLSEAETQSLVIITEDKDFGDLVFRDHLNSHGVILLRMGDFPVSFRLARLQAVWTTVEKNLPASSWSSPRASYASVTWRHLREASPIPGPSQCEERASTGVSGSCRTVYARRELY